MTQILATPLSFTQLLIILVLPCFLLFLIIVRGFNLKLGRINFNFKGIYTDKKLTVNDVLLVLEKTQAFKDAEYKILNQDKLKDQMNYAEQKINAIKSLMIDCYFELLAQKLKDKAIITTHKDYKNYDNLVSLLYENVRVLLRFAFKENGLEHIFETGKIQYNTHIDFKFESLNKFTTEFFNKRYDDKALISRKELYDANMKMLSKIKEIVYEIFYKALEISEEKTKKVKELEEKFKCSLHNLGIKE